MIQLALQRGYLNRGQIQAALQTQAQCQQRGQPTALLPLLRGSLQPAQIQELSHVYRQATQTVNLAASAATIQLPPDAASAALANSHDSFAATAAGSSAAIDPYASSAARQRALISSSSPPPQAQSTPAAAASSAAPGTPAMLGRFEIQRELARGGMGVVYVGRDPNLDRQVAIKCLLPGGPADPEQIERFRREGLAVARLKHPNIVQVYEVAEHAGSWYMVMDLVMGGSLNDSLKARGTYTPEDAARVVRDLARATACAHEHNVLHRDIKPHNVLLSPEGTPKLTDFGLAKLEDIPAIETQPAAPADHTAYQAVEIGLLGGASLTRGGQILGTPGYLPPEQAEGAKAKIDARSDIYSLGATLFALLAGRPPFVGDTILTVLQKLLSEPAPLVSTMRKGVDKRLEQIVARCLEREPDDRYPTAAELADALEAWIDRNATLQSTSKRRRAGPAESARGRAGSGASHRQRANPKAEASARSAKAGASGRRGRRSSSNAPMFIGLGAAVLGCGAMFLALNRRPATPADASPNPTETPVASATEPGWEPQDGPRWNDPPPPDEDPPWDDDPPPEQDDPPEDDPPEDDPPKEDPPPRVEDPGALLAEAERRIRAGEESEALPLLDRALELRPTDGEIWLKRASCHGRLADFLEAYSDASQALELKPEWPKALLLRGKAAIELGRLPQARRDFELVARLRRGKRLGREAERLLASLEDAAAPPRDPAPPRGDRERAMQLVDQAGAALNARQLPAALNHATAAVEADPSYLMAWAVRGLARSAQGDARGGLADANKAVELDPRHPDGYFYRGQILANMGKLKRALTDMRKAKTLAPPEQQAIIDQLIAEFERGR